MKNLSQLLSILCLLFFLTANVNAQEKNPFYKMNDQGQMELTTEGASHFARLALDCIHKEYPNKLNQVISDSSDLRTPVDLHPAFYGCFDWHSSVHGHWMLIRLLKMFPDLPEAKEIRSKINDNINLRNIKGEVAYFTDDNKSWERMYGWSWLLKLAEELHKWDDKDGQRWSAVMKPLVDVVIERYIDFLPRQSYPVRTGVHPNTAFGMTFAYDYALKTKDREFESLLQERALTYYENDKGCPANWEPSGEDFLSACLEEANLMSRVLPAYEFNKWFKKFLPEELLESLKTPADVSDRSDPKIVHLDGLNLSRAWCFYGISDNVKDVKTKAMMAKFASQHLAQSIPYVAADHYEGSHWLASFAVFALSVNQNTKSGK